MSQKYDAIIIGSGIGGLTCGAFLANSGKRVLVLEKHTKIGGYAHNFKRGKFVFESGIHSVSLSKDGLIMHMLRTLGIENKIETIEYPEMFSVQTPEISLTMPSKREDIDSFLYSTFSNDKKGVDNILKEAHLFRDNIMKPVYEYEKRFSPERVDFVSRFHNKSYAEFINSMVTDSKLRQLLFGQWPYVGSSPEYAPALFHFMMFSVHYFDGSHYCKGGFSNLSDAFASVIENNGGAIKTRQRVVKIYVENKLAKRVITEKGEDFEADIIVSNASPYITHNDLLQGDDQGKRWQKRLKGLNPSLSSVLVYLGLKKECRDIVPHNINFWYSSSDHDLIFSRLMKNKLDPVEHLIFLKSMEEDEPTLTLMNFAHISASSDWKKDKKILAEKMLAKAEIIYPGLRDSIEVLEIGSPTTCERYTSNTEGSIYGFENTKSMYGEAKMPINTHIDNLYQTGHWGKPGCGVWNVMYNAYAASKVILEKQ